MQHYKAKQLSLHKLGFSLLASCAMHERSGTRMVSVLLLATVVVAGSLGCNISWNSAIVIVAAIAISVMPEISSTAIKPNH